MPGPLLLIGIGGPNIKENEFNLAQIAATHRVALVDTFAPAWARPYLTRHLIADLTDIASTAEAVTSYAAHHEIRGVLTCTRKHLVTAARIAELLQKPSVPLVSLAACSDLIELRRALARHKIPQPRWAEARDSEDASGYADLFGYPVMIRPSSRAHAVATQARGPKEFRESYHYMMQKAGRAAADQPGRVLVEECLDGAHISAETVVLGTTDIQIAAITRTTFGPPPAQQATRHCVFAHDPFLHNHIIRQVVIRTVKALGITHGVLSVRMRLSPRGPRVTDVCAHLADDLVPLLVKSATGIVLPRIAADLSTAMTPNLVPSRQRAAAVQYLYPPATGRIRRLAVSPQADQRHLADRIVLTQQVGNQVASSPNATPEDRIAQLVVLGPDASSCHRDLDRMAQYVEVKIASSHVDATPSQLHETKDSMEYHQERAAGGKIGHRDTSPEFSRTSSPRISEADFPAAPNSGRVVSERLGYTPDPSQQLQQRIPQCGLTDMPRYLIPIVEALLSGQTDETVSRKLGISPRTYSRRVAELLEHLEVSTRFQGGAELIRRCQSNCRHCRSGRPSASTAR
ncbi:hypothetical protein ABK046_36830 [Streptomyces caeruleatus]